MIQLQDEPCQLVKTWPLKEGGISENILDGIAGRRKWNDVAQTKEMVRTSSLIKLSMPSDDECGENCQTSQKKQLNTVFITPKS